MASAWKHRFIPAALAQSRAQETVKLTRHLCAEHLDAEYGEFCARLVGRLVRQRPLPLEWGADKLSLKGRARC